MSLLVIIPVHDFSEQQKAVHQEGHSPYSTGGTRKEAIRVIADLVSMIRRAEPAARVVLHVDSRFKKFDLKEDPLNGLYICSERLETAYGGSHMGTFCAAYQYAQRRRIDHTHVLLMTSSEVPIRAGLYAHVKKWRAGYWKNIARPGVVGFANGAMQMSGIGGKLAEYLSRPLVYHSQIEGCYYAADVFEKIVRTIHLGGSADNQKLNLPAVYLEELLIATIASSFVPQDQTGDPVSLFYIGRGHVPMDLDDYEWVQKQLDLGLDVGRCWGPNNPVFTGQKQPADSIFTIKRVERQLKDPVRKHLMEILCNKI